MHIPDGYLSPSTCAVFGAAMLPVWYKATRKLSQEMNFEKVPFMAMGAVFSFLIMMFNVPIPDGTTAHAVGSVLIAITIGPWAAVVAVSIALFIQALVFGDGGVLAFGVNAFNMAFIMPFVGYYVYYFIEKKCFVGTYGQIVASFLAGYVALNMAALFAAVEFGVQPLLFKAANGTPLYCPYGLEVAVPAMLFAHLLIAGVVEGIVTGAAVHFVHNNEKIAVHKGV